MASTENDVPWLTAKVSSVLIEVYLLNRFIELFKMEVFKTTKDVFVMKADPFTPQTH